MTEENQTAETPEVAIDPALQEAVLNAETQVNAAVEAEKAGRERVKTAKKNRKGTADYLATLEDGSDAHAQYSENLAAWDSEVENASTAHEALKADVKEARAVLRKAKSAANPKSRGGAPKIEQNGQVKPRDNSRSGQMWAIFDAASEARGEPCAIGDVIDQCTALGVTVGSARSAYSHWRKFHGIAKGRITSAADAAQSAEKRAEMIAKTTEAIAKSETRLAKLREKLEKLQALEAAANAAEESSADSEEAA